MQDTTMTNGSSPPPAVAMNGLAHAATDAWFIPKGAKHYKEAMELIKYTCRPEVQLRLTKFINYGPTMPEAYANLDAAARAILPTSPENRPKQFVFDAQWWADNEATVVERWNKWLVK